MQTVPQNSDLELCEGLMDLLLATGFRVVYCPYSGDRKSHDEETFLMVQRLVDQTRQKRQSRSKHASAIADKDKVGFEEVTQSTSPEPFSIPIDPKHPKRPPHGPKSGTKNQDADIYLESTAPTILKQRKRRKSCNTGLLYLLCAGFVLIFAMAYLPHSAALR
jgi:hypothetical protein